MGHIGMCRCEGYGFQAEDGIRDSPQSRGLGDVYKRQGYSNVKVVKSHRKISSDLFAKGIEKFKAFIPFAEEGCLEAIPFGHPA